MAEHYVQLSHSDLEDVLQHVWVAGPGAASPGTLLSGPAAPLTREQAEALAIDLSRRSTPADGGFCTFQPVVDGGACPWNLDCHNCAEFVLSGADLLYWRRKREQWYSIAERAPDNAAAAYLHDAFAPTAAAIDGLEAALAGLGLLDDALAMDLRRPQDYFQRVWNIGFRATQLAITGAGEDPLPEDQPEADGDEPGELENSMTPDRTAAAVQARRRATEQKLQQVRDAVACLERRKAPATYPAVARQAGVSRTFLYANPDARALISDAVSKPGGPDLPAFYHHFGVSPPPQGAAPHHAADHLRG